VDQTHLESEKTKRWAGPCCFWGFPFSFLARAKRSQSVSVSHADTTIVIDPGTDKCCYGFSSLIRRTRRSPLGSLRRVDAHPPAVPNKREQMVELPNEFDLIRCSPSQLSDLAWAHPLIVFPSSPSSARHSRSFFFSKISSRIR
jgi:hypothetical protein